MDNKREISPLNLYHIYNRGNNKENIFLTDDEKELFLGFLNAHIKNIPVKVHCYSLMTNHLHLILEGPLAAISKLMEIIQSKFAKKYNMWHNRSGHVFQGKFGSVAVFSSKQYVDLYRYVVLNSSKAGLADDPFDYKWCSLNPNNSSINMAEEKVILHFFELEGVTLRNYLLDKSDERISYFDKKAFTMDQAFEFFNDQLIRYALFTIEDFLASPNDLIERILRLCRYYGIEIKQLQTITGLSFRNIQKASPSDDDYI